MTTFQCHKQVKMFLCKLVFLWTYTAQETANVSFLFLWDLIWDLWVNYPIIYISFSSFVIYLISKIWVCILIHVNWGSHLLWQSQPFSKNCFIETASSPSKIHSRSSFWLSDVSLWLSLIVLGCSLRKLFTRSLTPQKKNLSLWYLHPLNLCSQIENCFVFDQNDQRRCSQAPEKLILICLF